MGPKEEHRLAEGVQLEPRLGRHVALLGLVFPGVQFFVRVRLLLGLEISR